MINKYQDDSNFAQCKIYFYNPAIREVCHLELLVPNTHQWLTFVKQSHALADKASTDHIFEEHVTDTDDVPEVGDRTGQAFDASEEKKEDSRVPALSYSERQARDKAEAREREVATERQALLDRFTQDELNNLDGKLFQVFKPLAPMILLGATRTADKERNKAIFEEIKKSGPFREIASISEQKFDEIFNELELSHINFRAVIDFVKKSMQFAICRGIPQSAPPMLLLGPAGLGKTHFAKELAAILGTTFNFQGYDSDVKSTGLLGQDKGWSNSTTGIVYDTIIGGKHANPVILLDEIDKCSTSFGQYQHPLSSLHSLLEPVTHNTVKDISTELEFDASLVTWICTANHENNIPKTILSRLNIFHIHPITDAELAIEQAKVMLVKTHALMSLNNFSEPSPSLAVHIAHLTPREQRQELEKVYANAVASGRAYLQPSDFSHLDDESVLKTSPNKPYLH